MLSRVLRINCAWRMMKTDVFSVYGWLNAADICTLPSLLPEKEALYRRRYIKWFLFGVLFRDKNEMEKKEEALWLRLPGSSKTESDFSSLERSKDRKLDGILISTAYSRVTCASFLYCWAKYTSPSAFRKNRSSGIHAGLSGFEGKNSKKITG